MLKYKKNLTLSQGGIDIGLKVGILAEIGYMLHKCALPLKVTPAAVIINISDSIFYNHIPPPVITKVPLVMSL